MTIEGNHVQLYDRAPMSGVRRTADGYLVADAKVARAGVQIYRGAELGKPEMDTVRVYRPEEEVFARDSLSTYAHRPVTMDHPSTPVTADNWKELSIGSTGDEVVRDGEFIRVPLSIMDSNAIAEIEAGKRELSMGYMAALDWTDGTTPSGEKYDAVQRGLRMNHLAVVTAARGGKELKIGDANNTGGPNMPNDMKTRQVVVDGLTVETTEQGAQVIERLQKQLADSADAMKASTAKKDEELGKKDAEIEDLKKKVVDGAALDQLVADRASVVTKAKTIGKDIVTDGKPNADIRRAAVAAHYGDKLDVKDRSDEYVSALFDAITVAEHKNADPVRAALSDAQPNGDSFNISDADREAKLKRAGIPVRKGA